MSRRLHRITERRRWLAAAGCRTASEAMEDGAMALLFSESLLSMSQHCAQDEPGVANILPEQATVAHVRCRHCSSFVPHIGLWCAQ